MTQIVIMANGDLSAGQWLTDLLAAADYVIAADGGTRHLAAVSRLPDLFVGDGDSLTAELDEWLTENEVPRRRFAAEKDETDLELALLIAAAMQPTHLWVAGVFGGRVDQSLANLLLLAHPALAGQNVMYVGRYQRACLITTETTIIGERGDTVSLIPLGGDACVAHTAGLKWTLRDSVLQFGVARGISNVLTDTAATITLASGTLLCVHIDQAWQR